jgi:hypothetical protein
LFIIIVVTALLDLLVLLSIVIILPLLLALIDHNSFLCFTLLIFIILGVCGGFLKKRVVQWIEVLSLPVLSDIASSVLKVGAYRLMLLLTLDFSLYPLLRITPFLHCLLELLLPSLFLEDPVLVLKPDLLHFLFLHISSWDIAKEI